MRRLLPLAATCVLTLGACNIYKKDVNPSFPVTEAEAREDEHRMRADPVSLARPVLIVGGYRSPDFLIEAIAQDMAKMTSGDRRDFVRVPMWFEGDMAHAGDRLVEQLEEAFPSDDPERTIEVDVVAVSMGGLVSRYAADRREGKRLKINRLMTMATPHRGAIMAEGAPLIEDRSVVDMYRKSLFITQLDEAYTGDYEIIPYARLGDGVVGTINTAPPGRWPIWVSEPVLGASHGLINEDRRIMTDMARRLRGEEPRGVEGEPLPESEWDPEG